MEKIRTPHVSMTELLEGPATFIRRKSTPQNNPNIFYLNPNLYVKGSDHIQSRPSTWEKYGTLITNVLILLHIFPEVVRLKRVPDVAKVVISVKVN